jgi:hypothetical protein
MLQPEKSSARQVTYDSSDTKLQWRCHLHLLHKPQSLLAIALLSIILMAVTRLPPVSIIFFALGIVAVSLLQIKLGVARRASGPRVCTTSISTAGVNDVTPDTNKTYAWSQIKSIERSDGDIYFITAAGGLFVPISAFKDEALATAFFTTAVRLWQGGRAVTGGNLMDRPSSSGRGQPSSSDKGLAGPGVKTADPTSAPKAEDLLAEDESVWTALEDEHKKHNASAKGPEDKAK